MNTRLPCGLEDDRIRLEPDNIDHAKAVEDYADNLMADCKVGTGAESINRVHGLYDGDLLTDLMVEIANWTGLIESSHVRMKAMHVLLANELQKIAERETA